MGRSVKLFTFIYLFIYLFIYSFIYSFGKREKSQTWTLKREKTKY